MEEIIGKEIGIYKVLSKCNYKSKDGHKLYHVKCNICGWETDMRKERILVPSKCKHILKDGHYITNSKHRNGRLAKIYNNMIDRCYDYKNKDYRFYGAKGIRVYEDWKNNFLAFEKWAISNGYNDDLTIDRINASKDYCPENCRWVTKNYNSKYKTTTKLITVNGIAHTGREWAKICEIGTNAINRMLRKNSEELVIQFIQARLKDKTLTNNGNQNWLSVYCIE